jgi:hypothetical protein
MIYTGMSFWLPYYRRGIWYWAEMEQEFWFENWWLGASWERAVDTERIVW